ncbi:outer membrane protein assembly factor BamB family protein [Mangrovihabitans endophyticus]|uniref:Pyrrolo-quinoline quinone repeat domain-containing protein n=1 Tax=Mangrovihabitans endophyticus TaxID=1751298 RepID=A0A8J3FP99_9ACTN|nr:PQQ-binding-like beta-propeller repeat protein [Mangrovihabitans endophyticus]GGK88122.1 hypothetical protein GCM10012284_22750 [Mangrovihabitans endophyticus]
MVIDLDRVAPAHAPGRRGHRSPHARAYLVAAVLLAMAVLGGSASPARPLRVAFTDTGATAAFALTSTALFTADTQIGVDARVALRAYTLGTGAQRWESRLPDMVWGIDPVAGTGVLMVTATGATRAAFLDADTGRLLWRLDLSRAAVLRATAAGVLVSSGDHAATTLRLADLRSGATRWSRSLAADSWVDAGDAELPAPDRVIAVAPDGHATVLRLADGADLSSAELPGAARLTRLGDRLYAVESRLDGKTLTAYRLSDLRRLWTTSAVPLGRLSWCGPYVCDTTDAGMTILDGNDGAVRWSVRRWQLGYGSTATALPGPLRLIAIDYQDSPARALLDPGSGAVVADLGHTTVVGRVLLRTDTGQPARTWIQRMDAWGGTHAIAAVTVAAPHHCAAAGDYVACPNPAGQVVVWRLPP